MVKQPNDKCTADDCHRSDSSPHVLALDRILWTARLNSVEEIDNIQRLEEKVEIIDMKMKEKDKWEKKQLKSTDL